MTQIGRLIDVSARDAWKMEAQDFTPWLAQHLDELGAAVGLQLELQSTEAAVENFAADILARDPTDGSLVLIENQLEATDHLHLGQIMTYLAGLEAKTIIWIATSFREPHLSAINWLNEHTADPFAFFAVKLRVVRIGDSPFAPMFEVLARPSNWERRLQEIAGEGQGLSEIGQTRKSFWQEFLDRFPAERLTGLDPGASSNFWRQVEPERLVISLWFGSRTVGAFVRGWHGSDGSEVHARLAPHEQFLTTTLGAEFRDANGKYFLPKSFKIDTRDRGNWPKAMDWLHETAELYHRTLATVLQSAPVST